MTPVDNLKLPFQMFKLQSLRKCLQQFFQIIMFAKESPRDLTVNEDGFIIYGSFSRPEQKTIRRLLVYEGALDDIDCNNRNNLSGNESFTFWGPYYQLVVNYEIEAGVKTFPIFLTEAVAARLFNLDSACCLTSNSPLSVRPSLSYCVTLVRSEQ